MAIVISYNVNGIRAALKKGLVDWMKAANPDVLCIQEIKALKEQVDTEAIENAGYHHYWHSAEKKGELGTIIFPIRRNICVITAHQRRVFFPYWIPIF